jgi:hypothetical protein
MVTSPHFLGLPFNPVTLTSAFQGDAQAEFVTFITVKSRQLLTMFTAGSVLFSGGLAPLQLSYAQ